MKNSHSESYAAAGVDVTAGYESVERIKPMVESTYIPGVMGTLGGFGGMFAPDVAGMKKPVLVSGTDGVGTKLRLAQLMDKHDTIGIDCVAMCVNDIICGGAAPLFFLDYIACGKNDPARIAEIVTGITEGCRQSECALVGGETAEHPGLMPDDDYDVAGFSVGIVDEEKIIDGKRLAQGDTLIGSGLHRRPLQRLLPGAQGAGRGARRPHLPRGAAGGQEPGRDPAHPHPHLCQGHQGPAEGRRGHPRRQPHHRRRLLRERAPHDDRRSHRPHPAVLLPQAAHLPADPGQGEHPRAGHVQHL